MPPETPEAWLSRLEKKLEAQQREVRVYDDYYNGDHKLAFATLKFREAFGGLFNSFADNWCEIVVDAPVERLAIEGFRFGKDKPADEDAWEIWQANGLDAESVMAHTEAVKSGRAYLLVGPGKNYPRITVEHPAQFIVEHAEGDRRERVAALKKWRDDADGYLYATLYLPGRIYKYRSDQPQKADIPGRSVKWVDRDGGGLNRLGVVPGIPLYNNPTILDGGRSDLLPAMPLQDAIDKEIADMLVASEFAAYPQRILMGVQAPVDADGKPLPNFDLKAAVSRLLLLEGKDGKVAEFSAADLGNYVKAVTVLLQHLAAQTRTPPHYLLGQIVNASGDALKAAETGLVAKVKRKQIDFSDSWEEAMRLALKLAKKKTASEAVGAETIWRDPEYRSEGEMVDAAVKLRSLNVPTEAIWERIGASPRQIEDWAKKINLPERETLKVPLPPPASPAPQMQQLPAGPMPADE